jgi:hypothetical protein
MSGKLPIDRVREARKAPRIFVEHSERLAQQEAELRDANDPITGARPRASDANHDSAGARGDADEPENA